MNHRGVFFLLGRLLLALAFALAIPAVLSASTGTAGQNAFLGSAALAAGLGLTLQITLRPIGELELKRRDAFLLVTAAWVTASLFGAFPWIALKGPAFAIDALFESASGFTTTGASILQDIEREAPALLLWRSLTHWLGGMGIIVLGIAILPKLAVGGMELLGCEAPGPTTEKLTPRIAQTAKALWMTYALLTAAETAALWLLGLDVIEAVNHAFATMATGGFSTRNASIAAFDSVAIEMVITLFMVLAGANFALHYRLLRGRPGPLLRDREFRFYIGILVLATLALTASLLWHQHESDPLQALRYSVFQTVSIVTTTGFATADFDQWPSFSRVLILLLMFVGGCAGSTGGSVKVARIMIVIKKLLIDLKRLVRPHAVYPVRLGSRGIPDTVVASVTTFFLLFLTLHAFGGLVMAFLGMDMVSAFTASAACIGNIGPGFGAVGPVQNYADVPDLGKLVLVGLMLLGRLELYTVLALIFVWRRH